MHFSKNVIYSDNRFFSYIEGEWTVNCLHFRVKKAYMRHIEHPLITVPIATGYARDTFTPRCNYLLGWRNALYKRHAPF